MSSSIVWYLKKFFSAEWLHNFLFAKTAPLVTPPHFRDFPHITGKECTHCLSCMMICPAPNAIEVLKKGDGWEPVVSLGHCIRCGLCVEICPEDVLATGRILETQSLDHTGYNHTLQMNFDQKLCTGCGDCAVACPVNKVEDPNMTSSGTSSNDEVIMRVMNGKLRILHPEKCTGCKTCEITCSERAIRVARVVEPVQEDEIANKGGGTV